MRSLISFILLLALVNPCHAWLVIGGDETGAGSAPPAETDFCPTCPYDDTPNGDVACEDFEPTGYLCSAPAWSESLNGGTVDENNTPTGSWTCTDTDTKNLKIITSGATEATLSLAAEVAHSYGLFYFKVTAETVINNGYSGIFWILSDTSYTFVLRLSQDGSGNLFFEVGHRTDSDIFSTYYDIGASEGTPDIYSLGDEVRVRWDADTTATSGTATWYVRVGAAAERTVSFTENETDDGEGYRYFYFGHAEADAEDVTVEYNNIRIDDDTIPTICTGDS